jgi:hypothetical protein
MYVHKYPTCVCVYVCVCARVYVCVHECECVCTYKDIKYSYIWCMYIQTYIHVPHFFFVLNFLDEVGYVSHGARHVTFGKPAAPGVLCARVCGCVFYLERICFSISLKSFKKKISENLFYFLKKLKLKKKFLYRDVAARTGGAVGLARDCSG